MFPIAFAIVAAGGSDGSTFYRYRDYIEVAFRMVLERMFVRGTLLLLLRFPLRRRGC